MRKKIMYILAFALIAALSVAALCGCVKDDDRTVKSISIVDGSFKDSYNLDEVPDYSKAQIYVTYTNGKTEFVPINASMVSGLDTSVATLNGLLKVTYRGVSTERVYRVISIEGVKTPFRLSAEYSVDKGAGRIVRVKAMKCADVANGVYAVRFTIAASGGASLEPEVSIKCGDDWKMSFYVNSSTSITVVLYSASGAAALGDGNIIEVKATVIGGKGYLTIQNASMSDGVEDFVVPEANLNMD